MSEIALLFLSHFFILKNCNLCYYITTNLNILDHDVDFGQSEVVDMAFYKPHDQWNLVEPILFQNDFRSWQNIFNYSDKRLHLYIARDPTFYFYIFVCPIIILHVLSPFVFLLPVESGEKISMSITLLLAQTVSMSGIADVLPASSRNFPIISYFLGLSVVQIGIQTLLTVLGWFFKLLE